jgi:hypothetical protein
MSGWTKSSFDMPSAFTGAAKTPRARQTRSTFSGTGSTRISRSCVPRGTPCTASACAPTTRNRASASSKACNISTQSSFTCVARPERECFRANRRLKVARSVPTCAAKAPRPWPVSLRPWWTRTGHRLAHCRVETSWRESLTAVRVAAPGVSYYKIYPTCSARSFTQSRRLEAARVVSCSASMVNAVPRPHSRRPLYATPPRRAERDRAAE